MTDFSGYFAPLIVLLCLVLFLWRSKKRSVIVVLLYAFIEVWIEPLFPQPSPEGRFVVTVTKLLLVIFLSWAFMRSERKSGDA